MLAVDILGSLGSVRRLHIYIAFITFPLEELSRISQRHTVEVALVRMPSGDRQVVLSIKLQLLFCDAKRFFRDLAFDRPIQNIIGYICDAVGEPRSGDDFLDFRKRGFVLGPSESKPHSLLAGEGIRFHSDGFVVSEG